MVSNMKIIAHRGFWIKDSEKNTVKAFERALENGFGIETDLRDYNQKIVASLNNSKKRISIMEV